MGSANENSCYNVTLSFTGWAHTRSHPGILCMLSAAKHIDTIQWHHMGAMVPKIISNTTVCSTVCSGLYKRKPFRIIVPLWKEFTDDSWIIAQRDYSTESNLSYDVSMSGALMAQDIIRRHQDNWKTTLVFVSTYVVEHPYLQMKWYIFTWKYAPQVNEEWSYIRL